MMGEEGALDLQAEAAGLVLITYTPTSEGPPGASGLPQALLETGRVHETQLQVRSGQGTRKGGRGQG